MKRIKVIKPFNKRVKGDVFDCKDEKAKFWIDNKMAEYVKLADGEVIPGDAVHGAAVPVQMVKVRVLTPFNKRDKGDVFEAKEYKANFWIKAGMVEAVKVKKVAVEEKVTEAPERKIVEAEVKK